MNNVYLVQPNYDFGPNTTPEFYLPYTVGILWSYAAQFDDIKNKMTIAIKNAKQLERHNNSGKSINPSTNMHELIEYLMCLKGVDS